LCRLWRHKYAKDGACFSVIWEIPHADFLVRTMKIFIGRAESGYVSIG
jgi:hypothetical protein